MKQLEVADRYTRSVFELAEEKNATDALLQELTAVRQAMETRSELLHLLRSPLITRDEKRSLIEGILGLKSSPLSQQFLNLLVEKNRIDLFPSIVERLHGVINEKKNVQETTVLTARQLHPSIIQLIQKALEKAIKKQVIIETKTEPSLIGGLQIRMGNRLIDGSLRTKLDALRSQLAHARVT